MAGLMNPALSSLSISSLNFGSMSIDILLLAYLTGRSAMISLLSGSFNNALMKVGLGFSYVPKFISWNGSSTSGKELSSAAGAKSSTSSCKLSSSCSSVLS
ncbi:unnamed protein product [Prunus armeniaca]